MTEERKALHDLVDETPEEDIDDLLEFVNRLLHPSESPASQGIVFERVPAGSQEADELEERRRHMLADFKARQADMIARSIGDTVDRLGIDLNDITDGLASWSGSGGKPTEFSCRWTTARVLNRLGIFDLNKQRVVTFDRCHISETRRELIYKVRVLTPTAESEKELTVPI